MPEQTITRDDSEQFSRLYNLEWRVGSLEKQMSELTKVSHETLQSVGVLKGAVDAQSRYINKVMLSLAVAIIAAAAVQLFMGG